MTIVDGIDISHLVKAQEAFEYSYELCWKTMKRALETQGILAGSPKDTFRKAVNAKLIEDRKYGLLF